MATRTLTVDLFGRDRTLSKSMGDAGRNASRLGDTMRRAGTAAAAGLAVAGAAAVAFGAVSVRAFAEAQVQQERLNFAYAKFPAIADVTRESYDELNKALMLKTGFDDDAIASGQAILAQFGLTGKQLQRLTPLLLDYARAQGKDLTTAAEDVGKALQGQGRALKLIGLDFEDAGSLAANFDQVLSGLATNVGGYAEEFGTTAAGKVEILTAKWGDFQEKVGAALLPGLVKIMDFVQSDILPELQGFAEWFGTDGVVLFRTFTDGILWMIQNKELAVGAIAALTGAFWGMSAALNANPIGLVILGLSALVGTGVVVAANWDTIMRGMAYSVQLFAFSFNNQINAMISILNQFLAPVNAVIDALNRLFGMNIGRLTITPIKTNFNVPAQAPAAGPAGGRTGGRPIRAFAEGGLVKGGRGGVLGMIGEKNYDELVVPLKSGMTGLGGTTVVVNFNGALIGNEDYAGKQIVRIVQNATKRGQIPRGALA